MSTQVSRNSSVASGSPQSSAADPASETSLSSVEDDAGKMEPLDLASVDAKLINGHRPHGLLLDAYGTEFEVPNISINDIRAAIPKHCYQRSALRSLFYVARDLAQCSANWYLFRHILTPRFVGQPVALTLLWSLFTLIQGFIMTGIWVLAHECGHQAFSEHRWLNDSVGFLLHSALGVPYFAWQITHGKHHKATGHMERDQVFVPVRRDVYAARYQRLVHEVTELGEDAPLVAALTLIGQQLFGFIMYLSMNVTGHNCHEKSGKAGLGKRNGYGGGVNHFDPRSPIFDPKDRNLILLSDLGLLMTLGALTAIARTYGLFALTVGYIVPYFWVNNWLAPTHTVWITFLQHTDPTLPHYEPSAWTYTRGAAATIDREFGFIGRYFMHGIVETHVLHHFVSTIPFYHADEASAAIRPILGKHYRSNTQHGIWGFLTAIWTSARLCSWVEPSEGANEAGKNVLFFRNNNKKCIPPSQIRPKAQ